MTNRNNNRERENKNGKQDAEFGSEFAGGQPKGHNSTPSKQRKRRNEPKE
jgi:hypothetical protein